MVKKLFLVAIMVFTLLCPATTSNATDKITRDRDYYIVKYLRIFGNLKPADVLTVVQTETGGNVDIVTSEPNVRDYSYGPMQVRGKTARQMGFKGDLKELCTWEYGLYYGMKYLSWKKEEAYKKAHGPVTRRKHTWAGYNAGHPELVLRKGAWVYINQGYVDECESHYKNFVECNELEKYNMPKELALFTETEPTGRD